MHRKFRWFVLMLAAALFISACSDDDDDDSSVSTEPSPTSVEEASETGQPDNPEAASAAIKTAVGSFFVLDFTEIKDLSEAKEQIALLEDQSEEFLVFLQNFGTHMIETPPSFPGAEDIEFNFQDIEVGEVTFKSATKASVKLEMPGISIPMPLALTAIEKDGQWLVSRQGICDLVATMVYIDATIPSCPSSNTPTAEDSTTEES